MAVDPTTHGIRGYASVFGNQDDRGTIFDRGAFADAVAAVAVGDVFPLVYSHSVMLNLFGSAKPIGVVTALREDDRGLYYEAMLHDTQEARDVLTCVADGSVAGASFSFDPVAWEVDYAEIKHFTRVKLYELGPCVWGANPLAYAEAYALDDDTDAADPADDEDNNDNEDEMAAALLDAAEEIANVP